MSKLALGTVQFGLPYGITNSAGQVPPPVVRAILAHAAEAGVDLLDTAAAYGNAEQVLGDCLAPDAPFRLVSKTLPLAGKAADLDTIGAVAAALERSLLRLRRPHIDGLLVHHANDLLGPGGQQLYAMLRQRQDDGVIGKLGVSVYDGEQLAALLPQFPIELVQLPLNILDQRLLQSGWLARLAERGVEIHVRSAFLQGTLLADAASLPDHLGVVKQGVARFQQDCAERGQERAAACLAFLQGLPEIAYVVAGVADEAQFAALAQSWTLALAQPLSDAARLAVPDHPLLSPHNWPPAA